MTWEDVRKAVAPDLEEGTLVPEHIAGRPGVRLLHTEDRLAYETLCKGHDPILSTSIGLGCWAVWAVRSQ